MRNKLQPYVERTLCHQGMLILIIPMSQESPNIPCGNAFITWSSLAIEFHIRAKVLLASGGGVKKKNLMSHRQKGTTGYTRMMDEALLMNGVWMMSNVDDRDLCCGLLRKRCVQTTELCLLLQRKWLVSVVEVDHEIRHCGQFGWGAMHLAHMGIRC